MPPYKVKVEIVPRAGEADPTSMIESRKVQSSGIEGLQGVRSVRVHQLIEFIVHRDNIGEAQKTAEEMCELLLVNPVLSTGEIDVSEL